MSFFPDFHCILLADVVRCPPCGNVIVYFRKETMKTFIQKVDHPKQWFLVDATNQTLGRLATVVANHLTGKHRPEYTPFLDTGDYVVVVNASKIHATGKKLQDKKYYHYSGYQSGLKEINLEDLLAKDATAVIKSAVKGMLPKGPLGRKMFSKLKVYAGAEHPHQAQQLTNLTLA